MRHLYLALSLFVNAACQAAPGAPMTDVTATTTEVTGPYRVLERAVDGTRYTFRVEAMRPERAQAIADHIVYQVLSKSPDEVTVEVRPHESVSGETTRIRWVRGGDVPASAAPRPQDGTAPGDRIGNRPTGQSGTSNEH